jgi:hypothetical protein
MVRIFSERLAQWDCAMKAMLGAGTGAVRMDKTKAILASGYFASVWRVMQVYSRVGAVSVFHRAF